MAPHNSDILTVKSVRKNPCLLAVAPADRRRRNHRPGFLRFLFQLLDRKDIIPFLCIPLFKSSISSIISGEAGLQTKSDSSEPSRLSSLNQRNACLFRSTSSFSIRLLNRLLNLSADPIRPVSDLVCQVCPEN
jgi:hypothetical protein